MMDIVLCGDGKYAMQMSVTIMSACVQNQEEAMTFHIIADETLKARQKKKMESCLKRFENKHIEFHLFENKYFDNYPNIGVTNEHVSKASYYRLLMADILPQHIKKALYLDGDIIIVDSLRELWNTDIQNHPIATVADMDENESAIIKRMGYGKDKGYFNAGVLLVNLDYWRKNNIVTVFSRIIKEKNTILTSHDQDVLNLAFYDNKLKLPLKYNVQSGFLLKREFINIDLDKYETELEEAIQHPVIIHFSCKQKPWIIGCQIPHTDLFEKYRDMTPWRHRSIIDTLRYSGLRHTVGFYARKYGLKAPMENRYMQC